MTKGFTLIEIMIGIALAAIILPALVFAFSFSLQAARQGEKYTKAYALAQEQMEAIYAIRKNDVVWDWETTPANTVSGEYYQPQLVSDTWQLGSKTTNPTEVGGYTKKVQVEAVKRDASGNLSSDPWATVDDYSRWITVTVSWQQNGQNEEVELNSLVTYY